MRYRIFPTTSSFLFASAMSSDQCANACTMAFFENLRSATFSFSFISIDSAANSSHRANPARSVLFCMNLTAFQTLWRSSCASKTRSDHVCNARISVPLTKYAIARRPACAFSQNSIHRLNAWNIALFANRATACLSFPSCSFLVSTYSHQRWNALVISRCVKNRSALRATCAASTISSHRAKAARSSLFVHHAIAFAAVARASCWSSMKFCHFSHAALSSLFARRFTNPATLNRVSAIVRAFSRHV